MTRSGRATSGAPAAAAANTRHCGRMACRSASGSATRVSGAVNDAGACVSNAVASATPESSSSTRAAA
ncbi:Uncharacterised protein [Bordetella pertussis]|nr:Uncharacterised protein [Bordetella pertussis]